LGHAKQFVSNIGKNWATPNNSCPKETTLSLPPVWAIFGHEGMKKIVAVNYDDDEDYL
jgi:hypothetical protein